MYSNKAIILRCCKAQSKQSISAFERKKTDVFCRISITLKYHMHYIYEGQNLEVLDLQHREVPRTKFQYNKLHGPTSMQYIHEIRKSVHYRLCIKLI